MFGLQILDVAIGLVFLFLLLSLAVTAANELIASWLKRRSATMWRGVVRLLGSEDWANKVYSHPLIAGLSDEPWFSKYREKLPFKTRPSYIPSRTFALALLDTLAPSPGAQRLTSDNLRAALAAHKDARLAGSLAVLLDDAAGDIEEFKKKIEAWFDASMERVSGWYKRRTQWILLLLAAIVTVWMNADTIVIANTLWRDPAVRSAVAAQAQRFAEEERKQAEAAEAASKRYEQTVARLQTLAIPLGWRDGARSDDPRDEFPRGWTQWSNALNRHLLGWLLTALAISLGAPFWFDMLNKVIAVRAAGKLPEKKPKSRQESAG